MSIYYLLITKANTQDQIMRKYWTRVYFSHCWHWRIEKYAQKNIVLFMNIILFNFLPKKKCSLFFSSVWLHYYVWARVSEGENYTFGIVLDISSYNFSCSLRWLSDLSNLPSDSKIIMINDNFSRSVYVLFAILSLSM